MLPQAGKGEAYDNGEDNYHENNAEVRVDNALSGIYIDLHRQSTKRKNFDTQNLSLELSAIALPIGKSTLSFSVYVGFSDHAA